VGLPQASTRAKPAHMTSGKAPQLPDVFPESSLYDEMGTYSLPTHA